MARLATNADVYNAIAEPRRRAILELLTRSEHEVNDIAATVGIAQPSASKHLRVLREVDLVVVRRDGRRRLYSANGAALRPVRDWLRRIERLWSSQLDSIQTRAEARKRRGPSRGRKGNGR